MSRNKIDTNAPAYAVSLNTPIPQLIEAAQFDLYLNQINPALYNSEEAFTSIQLVDAATDFITIVYESVGKDGSFTHTIKLRVGGFTPCRGLRILSAGTDPTAVILVGVGN